MCSSRISSFCSTSGTRRLNLVKNPVINTQYLPCVHISLSSLDPSGHCCVPSQINLAYIQSTWLPHFTYPMVQSLSVPRTKKPHFSIKTLILGSVHPSTFSSFYFCAMTYIDLDYNFFNNISAISQR